MKTLYYPVSDKYKRDYFESERECRDSFSWVENLEVEQISERDYLLSQVPEEFRSTLSYMAYQSGHSAGENEILLILNNLVFNLKPAIDKFEARLKSGK